MLYAVLCYDSEDVAGSWIREEDDAATVRLAVVQEKPAAESRQGALADLLPTAATMRKGSKPLVSDGPFAETKERQ